MKRFLLKLAYNDSVRIKTWKKLSSLLRHNIGTRQALIMMRDRYQVRRHSLASLFDEVIGDVDKGHQLDVAFYPWIPHEEVMLIRGGIKSAALPEALADCAVLIDARRVIVKSLINAVSYPIILVSLLVVLLLTVALYVVPELSLISDPNLWDGAAAAMYAVSVFIASPAGAFLLLLAGIGFLAVILSLPYMTGPLRARLDNFPPWSIYRLLTGSVWLFTVATLMKANIQLDFILTDMLENELMKPWLRERVQLIKDRYQVEGNFGTLLLNLGMNFPDKELVEDLAVYATLPDFHKNMYGIAKEWLDEGVERINSQAKALNIGLLIGILVILCGLGIAIGSMQQQLGNSMGGF